MFCLTALAGWTMIPGVRFLTMGKLTLHPQPVKVRLGAVDPWLGAAAPHHVHAGLHGE